MRGSFFRANPGRYGRSRIRQTTAATRWVELLAE